MRHSYNSIDLMKMIAAIFVVAIHSQPFSGLTEVLVINLLARIAVPFFFVASAFFFFKKPAEQQNLKGYVRRLAILYIFWFIIELPITILHSFIEPQTPFIINLLKFFKNIFFGSTFYGSWFIVALIECIPIISILSRRISNKTMFSIAILLYSIVVLSTYYIAFLPDSLQEYVCKCQNIIGHVEITWMSAFIFCLIGKYIAEHESKLIKQSYSLTGLIFLLSIIEVFAVNSLNPPTTNDFYFMLVPLVTTIFILLLQHESKFNLNYKLLRIYSTIFFFSHFIFVFIFVVINKHIIPINPLVKYGLVLLLCLITSFTIHQLSLKNRFKWLSYSY